jgi:hypothetical protein
MWVLETEWCIFLEFKTHLNFSTGKNMKNMRFMFVVMRYLNYEDFLQNKMRAYENIACIFISEMIRLLE